MFGESPGTVLFRLRLICGIAFCFLLHSNVHAQRWTPLFNGKDLTGWDTYLRATNLVGYVDDPSIPYEAPIGLNNDPLRVFTVSDGVIRISGEVWGAITTWKPYSNYHLRFESKWGEKKWYPKDTALRDGGLLFHCTGPFDYASKCWMRSVEMQIQETEIGDYYDVYGGVPEFQLSPAVTLQQEKVQQYDPLAPLRRYSGRVYRSGNFESPHGEWTRGELVARHADAVFIVNGFVVNRLYNIFRQDINRQATGGKLQFQSEGAEHYLRNIEIRPLQIQRGWPVLKSTDSVVHVGRQGRKNIEIANSGDAVEIIAVELLGKNIEGFVIQLPDFPLVLKKNKTLQLPVSLRPGTPAGSSVLLRLETVSGPVPDFEVRLAAD